MHRYETLFVLHPELPEAQVRETGDRVRRLIEGMGGQVLDLQDWGVRELAYAIQKQSRGTYILVQYAAPAAAVKELERTLKIADEVLRYISVRMPEPRKSSRRGARARAAAADAQGQNAAPEQRS